MKQKKNHNFVQKNYQTIKLIRGLERELEGKKRKREIAIFRALKDQTPKILIEIPIQGVILKRNHTNFKLFSNRKTTLDKCLTLIDFETY